MNLPENWDSHSSPDFSQDYQAKNDELDKRKKQKLGFFENSRYMNQIFPSLKIQKPGYDLYGTTTTIFAIICVFVFIQFKEYTFDASAFVEGSSEIWGYDKALTMVFLIFVMLLERVVNRTDTKKVESKNLVETKSEETGYLA